MHHSFSHLFGAYRMLSLPQQVWQYTTRDFSISVAQRTRDILPDFSPTDAIMLNQVWSILISRADIH